MQAVRQRSSERHRERQRRSSAHNDPVDEGAPGASASEPTVFLDVSAPTASAAAATAARPAMASGVDGAGYSGDAAGKPPTRALSDLSFLDL